MTQDKPIKEFWIITIHGILPTFVLDSEYKAIDVISDISDIRRSNNPDVIHVITMQEHKRIVDELKRQNDVMRKYLKAMLEHGKHHTYDNNWAVYILDMVKQALTEVNE